VAGHTRVFLFCHGGKSSSSPPPLGEPTTVVAVALWGEEYHVVAAVKGIELESAFIPFVSFGDLDNTTFKGLTSLLSVEQEIQYDEHT
jgi:hypothetical protein